MKYANIIFDGNRKGSYNLGDDIQLIAVQNIYNHMGIKEKDIVRIGLSQLSTYDGEYVILPISFPLYGYRKDLNITMFSPKIIPVFLALSIMSNNISVEEQIYLRRFEPIGCRDYYTVQLLREKNIMAYFNGCLTALLPKQKVKKEPNKIYIVDVPQKDMRLIPEKIREKAQHISQVLPECSNPEKEAKLLLEMYANTAKLVITTRLHCALPCVAMGIPVVLMKDNFSFRFSTISKFIHVYSKDEYNIINWQPQVINYEEEKQYLIDRIIHRIQQMNNQYSPVFEISSFFEKNNICGNVYIEHYDNIIEKIDSQFSPNDKFEYAIWGITQKADLICTYLEKKYKNSKLVAVFDRSKKVNFHGLMSSNDEKKLLEPSVFVFVCAATANNCAEELFKKNGKIKYFISRDGII